MTITHRIPTKIESQTTFRSGQLSHQPPSRPKLQILEPKWRGKRSMKEENGYTEARMSKGKVARGSNGKISRIPFLCFTLPLPLLPYPSFCFR
ncbi:hypothetical protein COLO4_02900 [Corchorus olitorius]|uniref:Uncharacterized protein n=1 Tax=Corchorus olitorius TaxID=93759 RepID=A0A1R3KZZ2_9ROSI|nr:hypothetical protein COLO4_02900 [Corchorus olitorius]